MKKLILFGLLSILGCGAFATSLDLTTPATYGSPFTIMQYLVQWETNLESVVSATISTNELNTEALLEAFVTDVTDVYTDNDTNTMSSLIFTNADWGDVSVATGVVSLDADVVAAAEMANADHGDVSWSSGVATVDNVAAGNLTGNIPVANITNALIDAIGADELADVDLGDISISSGVASLDADVVDATHFADADWGDMSALSGSVTLDADVVAAAEMADADHGDVAWSNGVATVQEINSVAVATVTSGAAAGATAYQPNATNLLTEGYFDIINATQLVFMAGGVTNVIDADIGN